MCKVTILLEILLMLFSTCTDEKAYASCKETLIKSKTKISQAETLLDARTIDGQLNDTLYKYGHSKMSKSMIDEIKELKSSYEKARTERLEHLKDTDTVPARRIVEMPGIGLVEIKTPPEV